MDLPLVKIRVVCSKGTYIRTLCHDIGQKLRCGGAMKSLIRSRVGDFPIKEAITLSQIETLRDEGTLFEKIVKVEEVFSSYPSCIVDNQFKKLLENGNAFYKEQIADFLNAEKIAAAIEEAADVKVYDQDKKFDGIYGFSKGKSRFEPKKMFLEKE